MGVLFVAWWGWRLRNVIGGDTRMKAAHFELNSDSYVIKASAEQREKKRQTVKSDGVTAAVKTNEKKTGKKRLGRGGRWDADGSCLMSCANSSGRLPGTLEGSFESLGAPAEPQLIGNSPEARRALSVRRELPKELAPERDSDAPRGNGYHAARGIGVLLGVETRAYACVSLEERTGTSASCTGARFTKTAPSSASTSSYLTDESRRARAPKRK